jgi:hypothetical protein
MFEKIKKNKLEIAATAAYAAGVIAASAATYILTRDFYTAKRNDAIAEMNLIARSAGLLPQLI